MAPITRGQGAISIDNASGTLTDISSGCQSFGLDVSISGGTYFTLGDSWQKALVGGRSAQLTLQVIMENGSGNAYELLRKWALGSNYRAARNFRADQPDSTTGSIRYSGQCRLNGSVGKLLDAQAGDGNVASVSVTLPTDGAVTEAVIA